MMERRLDPAVGEWRTYLSVAETSERCPYCPSVNGIVTEIPRRAFEIAVVEDRPASPQRTSRGGASVARPPYDAAPVAGAAEVVVYSEEHETSLAQLGADRIEQLVHVWADRYVELGRREEIQYVFIFENRGDEFDERTAHPHGFVYGFPEIPRRPRRKLERGLEHLALHGTCVLCDIVSREHGDGVRVVAQNDSFIAFVPFAPRFPYEIHVLSRRHAPSLLDLTDGERRALALLLETVLRGYDALFGFPLLAAMAMHQAPTDDNRWEAVSHFQIEFTPLHRSATETKALAAPELAAGAFVVEVPLDPAGELRSAIARS
jgi:UDPglucose--hexose-1-phosphate uridylyltransferase